MKRYEEITGSLSGAGLRFALVVSRFNDLITERLLEGAVDALARHGVEPSDLQVIRVPGAWELPGAVARVLDGGEVDAVVTLGCVIRGATPHFDFVAGEALGGLGALARTASVPVILGVLTTDTLEQALERAGSKGGNKGWEAAVSALEMANLYKGLK
jgi:6,7-dimethyl-8-ribityllumazine synthase